MTATTDARPAGARRRREPSQGEGRVLLQGSRPGLAGLVGKAGGEPGVIVPGRSSVQVVVPVAVRVDGKVEDVGRIARRSGMTLVGEGQLLEGLALGRANAST